MEQGYEATTMRNIAQTTDIKLGSITYYFKSKEEMLFESMKAIVESGEKRALAAVEYSNSTLGKLRALTVTELDLFINETGSIVINEWRCLSEEHKNALLDHRKIYEDLWLMVLDQCFDEGLIGARPDIARKLLQGTFAWVGTWYSAAGILGVEELADEVMKLVTQAHPEKASGAQ